MLLLDSSAFFYKKESIYKAMGLEIVYYFYSSMFPFVGACIYLEVLLSV